MPQNNTVQVSDITSEGFRIHTPDKEYYINRKTFPWFQDATDDEIRDVTLFFSHDNYHGNILHWNSLNVDFGVNSIENTDWIKTKAIYVRGVHRPDLRQK